MHSVWDLGCRIGDLASSPFKGTIGYYDVPFKRSIRVPSRPFMGLFGSDRVETGLLQFACFHALWDLGFVARSLHRSMSLSAGYMSLWDRGFKDKGLRD